MGGDVVLVKRKRRHGVVSNCTGHDFVFSTATSPDHCDVSFPSGLRPNASEVHFTPDWDKVRYDNKINIGFWRGGLWPGRRCGDWKESPRTLMVNASKTYNSIINASFSGTACAPKEPRDMCLWAQTTQPSVVSKDEMMKYRFLPTSAPACTYTGRLVDFLSSNSVVLKFSDGAEMAAQPMYAGLQDGVHLVLAEP